jgi:hypothetical protein
MVLVRMELISIMVDVYSVVDRLGCDMNAMPNAVRRREDDASCSGVLSCGLENATLMLVDVRSLYANRAWWLTGELFTRTVAATCGRPHNPKRVAIIVSFEGDVVRGRVWKRELAQEDFPATLGIISSVIVLGDLGRGSMFVVTLLDGTDLNRFGQSQ